MPQGLKFGAHGDSPAPQASYPSPRPSHPRSQVYGGAVRLPRSPQADMHGMVRAVVRARLFGEVIKTMAHLGVQLLAQDLNRTWTVSTSAIEIEITEGQYGEVFTCPITTQYLRPEAYTKITHTHPTTGTNTEAQA